jgi:hypothetical protein
MNSKVKLKFSTERAMKAQRGSGGIVESSGRDVTGIDMVAMNGGTEQKHETNQPQ